MSGDSIFNLVQEGKAPDPQDVTTAGAVSSCKRCLNSRKSELGKLECRFNPPETHHSVTFGAVSLWPEVPETGWCREFEDRDDYD